MFWEVLLIILNDQDLLAACSNDVGRVQHKIVFKSPIMVMKIVDNTHGAVLHESTHIAVPLCLTIIPRYI